MSNEYKNYIELHHQVTGDDRRLEMMSEALQSGSFLPETVEYKDIDEAFTKWVEKDLSIASDDGNEFPTMILFSNQRFSEYSQSWKYTDSNNNLLLNFKTITRQNNPEYGKIQDGLWNIPNDGRFYTMKKQLVLDDNGSESFLVLKMKQPTAIDLNYKVSVFTTQYHSINEFNMMVNKLFNARQCYIQPNGHYMAMTLEGISDESTYSIDDRQFYGQTFNIRVMAYIITKDDYRVDEVPYKEGVTFPVMKLNKTKPDVYIEGCEHNDNIMITINYPVNCSASKTEFTIDTDVVINNIQLKNLYRNYKIYVNDEERDKSGNIILNNNDIVKIRASRQIKNEEAVMILKGKMNNF